MKWWSRVFLAVLSAVAPLTPTQEQMFFSVSSRPPGFDKVAVLSSLTYKLPCRFLEMSLPSESSAYFKTTQRKQCEPSHLYLLPFKKSLHLLSPCLPRDLCIGYELCGSYKNRAAVWLSAHESLRGVLINVRQVIPGAKTYATDNGLCSTVIRCWRIWERDLRKRTLFSL